MLVISKLQVKRTKQNHYSTDIIYETYNHCHIGVLIPYGYYSKAFDLQLQQALSFEEKKGYSLLKKHNAQQNSRYKNLSGQTALSMLSPRCRLQQYDCTLNCLKNEDGQRIFPLLPRSELICIFLERHFVPNQRAALYTNSHCAANFSITNH